MPRQNTQHCYWLPSDFVWTFCMCLPIHWFLLRILSSCEHYVHRTSVLCFIKGCNLLQASVTYWDTAYTDLGYGTSFSLYQLKMLLCESVTLARMCMFSFTTKCSLSHCLSALHMSVNKHMYTLVYWQTARSGLLLVSWQWQTKITNSWNSVFGQQMVATHVEILCCNGIRKCVHAVGKPRYLALIPNSLHSPSYFSKIVLFYFYLFF
jgi:hypothetical protein